MASAADAEHMMSTTFGLFNTSVMGMAAQSDALANISENIANSSTVGYKESSTQFLTVLNGFQNSEAFGGGVETRSRYNITGQGALQHTGAATDLAIKGAGFFVVTDGSGTTMLTRAGSFVPDAQGRLVNAAGYYLMGFSAANAPSSTTSNALSSMQLIKVRTDKLFASASTAGTLSANLPAGATIVAAANLPSTNSATAQYSAKTSLTTYDNLGNAVKLDVYYAKTGANTWEMSAYNSADASASGGFPYASAALTTQTLTFSAANGGLTSSSPVSIAIPGGATVALDISNTTQLGAGFSVNNANVNGNSAGAISQIQIGSDGSLNYLLDNGQSIPAFKIGLANVASPTNLTSLNGDVFAANSDSGQIYVGSPGTGGLGTILSQTLESSTVDLATELSSMIISQRAFTANSQVFQVASDVLQVLNNLK
jgi:flagellar hook protein FlgE